MFLFPNRTCFNGLFRVNSHGRFNVPQGRYHNPPYPHAENLRAVSGLLARVTIRQGDFTESLPFVDEQTFIYIDPPYRPLSTTAKFTSYAKNTFTDADQIRLAGFCRKVDVAGARFMLSNSDPRNTDPGDSFFDDLYRGFSIERVSARRAINRNGSGRCSLTEIVVTKLLTPGVECLRRSSVMLKERVWGRDQHPGGTCVARRCTESPVL